MRSALIVYIALFVLLAIPLVWFGVKALLDKKLATRKKAVNASACAAGFIVLAVLCVVLYQITLATQPLLVIERFVKGVQSSPDAAATQTELADAGIIKELANFNELYNAVKAKTAFSYAKVSNDDNENFYLMIGEDGDAVAKIKASPNGQIVSIVQADLLSPEDAAKAIKERNFVPLG